MIPADVPSPIDLQDMKDAKEWERTAMLRPFREEFFQAFTTEISTIRKSDIDLLELGSGPGFLAKYILSRINGINFTLLDFSEPMHELARQRLSEIKGSDIHYLLRSFKESDWADGINKVNVVVTNQAVHELRHKRYAPALFVQVHRLLKPDGVLLFCDHYSGEDGLGNDQLYMSRSEQREAMACAGFHVTEIFVKGGRALYRALPNHQFHATSNAGA
ncbi:MAG: class I SAM-dependent methyltransferase [Thermodesulfovibrionia bacterium]|nr:class I SAM-dependent methyltransferase [Thermodesulfovibrionia bacterium]